MKNPSKFGPRIQLLVRRLRPAILHIGAHMDSIFPPESPTSKRRGGNKTAMDEKTKLAVCQILDAMNGNPWHSRKAFDAAMASADAEYFRQFAQAAEYIQDMPQGHSVFARHVIAAKQVAGNKMGPEGPLPRWRDVRREVSKELGQAAYGDKSPEWSRVKAAATLTDLPP